MSNYREPEEWRNLKGDRHFICNCVSCERYARNVEVVAAAMKTGLGILVIAFMVWWGIQ